MKMSKVGSIVCAVTLSTSLQVNAATEIMDDTGSYDVPDAPSMIMDTMVAKPIHAVMAVGGAAMWLVSLPFALITDSQEESWNRLIAEPVSDFRRCLGCTVAQDDSKILYDYTERQKKDAMEAQESTDYEENY